MFDHLCDFRNIIVTGPQRSGTTICARMIAHDTGLEFMPEERFGVADEKLLRRRMKGGGYVVQCPSLCGYAHDLSDDYTAVVLMRRAVEDIIRSQERIGWAHEKLELSRYDLKEGVIAEVKYAYWDEHQRDRITNAIEVEYDSLAGHPLWIPAERRRGFNARQTSEDA